MSKKYKSEPMVAIHEMVVDLHIGGVSGKQTMRRFDGACLTTVQEKDEVSQSVLATDLNVTSSLGSK